MYENKDMLESTRSIFNENVPSLSIQEDNIRNQENVQIVEEHKSDNTYASVQIQEVEDFDPYNSIQPLDDNDYNYNNDNELNNIDAIDDDDNNDDDNEELNNIDVIDDDNNDIDSDYDSDDDNELNNIDTIDNDNDDIDSDYDSDDPYMYGDVTDKQNAIHIEKDLFIKIINALNIIKKYKSKIFIRNGIVTFYADNGNYLGKFIICRKEDNNKNKINLDLPDSTNQAIQFNWLTKNDSKYITCVDINDVYYFGDGKYVLRIRKAGYNPYKKNKSDEGTGKSGYDILPNDWDKEFNDENKNMSYIGEYEFKTSKELNNFIDIISDIKTGFVHARSIRDKNRGNLIVFERGDDSTGIIRLFTMTNCKFDSLSKNEFIDSKIDMSSIINGIQYDKLKIIIYSYYDEESQNRIIKVIFDGTISGFDTIFASYSFSNNDFYAVQMDDVYNDNNTF